MEFIQYNFITRQNQYMKLQLDNIRRKCNKTKLYVLKIQTGNERHWFNCERPDRMSCCRWRGWLGLTRRCWSSAGWMTSWCEPPPSVCLQLRHEDSRTRSPSDTSTSGPPQPVNHEPVRAARLKPPSRVPGWFVGRDASLLLANVSTQQLTMLRTEAGGGNTLGI